MKIMERIACGIVVAVNEPETNSSQQFQNECGPEKFPKEKFFKTPYSVRNE
jgi:hypothetical protein